MHPFKIVEILHLPIIIFFHKNHVMEYVYIITYAPYFWFIYIYIYYRSESDVIKSLVQDLIRLLHKTYYLFVANHPVGVESRVQNVIQLLNNKQPKHSLVAVDSENRVGMHDLVQGVGKTVLSEKSSSMAEVSFVKVYKTVTFI